jgi:broad specificity polyphosphatase/5'/3'-nucleotidase SurE
MEKFLRIPVTGEQYQLVSATGIVLIEQATTGTVTIAYKGGSTGTDIVTISHATAGSGDETMRDAIQDAVIQALQTSWTKPAFTVTNLPYAVSGIAVA